MSSTQTSSKFCNVGSKNLTTQPYELLANFWGPCQLACNVCGTQSLAQLSKVKLGLLLCCYVPFIFTSKEIATFPKLGCSFQPSNLPNCRHAKRTPNSQILHTKHAHKNTKFENNEIYNSMGDGMYCVG
jgi:hypothetical protein